MLREAKSHLHCKAIYSSSSTFVLCLLRCLIVYGLPFTWSSGRGVKQSWLVANVVIRDAEFWIFRLLNGAHFNSKVIHSLKTLGQLLKLFFILNT